MSAGLFTLFFSDFSGCALQFVRFSAEFEFDLDLLSVFRDGRIGKIITDDCQRQSEDNAAGDENEKDIWRVADYRENVVKIEFFWKLEGLLITKEF